MPTYIVSLKENTSKNQLQKLIGDAKDQGGEILHVYNLINGFSVRFPEGHVQTLDQDEDVESVELDQEVRI